MSIVIRGSHSKLWVTNLGLIKSIWALLLFDTLAFVTVLFKIHIVIGITADFSFYFVLPSGTASLITLALIYLLRNKTQWVKYKLLLFFIFVALLDFILVRYSVYVIGFYIAYLPFLHLIAFVIGLVYFGIKIFSKNLS